MKLYLKWLLPQLVDTYIVVSYSPPHILFLQLIWRYFLNTESSGDYGTLYQLRNRISRTNVGKRPSKDCNAYHDFLLTIIAGHVTAAFTDLSESESVNFDLSTIWIESNRKKKENWISLPK